MYLFSYTSILNDAELKSRVDATCLKHINWSGKREQSPLIFTIEELNELQQARENPTLLFARKFDPNMDAAILDYMDHYTDEDANKK